MGLGRGTRAVSNQPRGLIAESVGTGTREHQCGTSRHSRAAALFNCARATHVHPRPRSGRFLSTGSVAAPEEGPSWG